MNKKLIIFGNTNYAEMVCDYFDEYSEYDIVLFTVNRAYRSSEFFYNRKIVDFEDIEKFYTPDEYDMFIAIGSSYLNKLRESVFYQAIKKGYKLPSFIHPKACIDKKVLYGRNCIFMENSTIACRTLIGDNIIVWPTAYIGHNNIIRDHCYIVGSTNGFCDIGENCFLGSKAVIADHIKVAKNNFISMAAAVISNTQENSVYQGVPAKKRLDISATDFVEELRKKNKKL